MYPTHAYSFHSGKSTLLNALRTCAKTCSHGDVRVSIRDPISRLELVVESDSFADYVGYVPQEDILDRDLTVRELLMFNALTRRRSGTLSPNNPSASSAAPLISHAEARIIVDQVLSDLSLHHVADSVIGGGENKAANISGGQVKRVNIGVELVSLSRPSILLLDEPTAGLDAAIAYDLVQSLQRTVQRETGITIVMVIQQPRVEIFEMLDHLLLMNRKGGIVFEGRSCDVNSHLTSEPLRYRPNEEDTSDADFCLDVLNGIATRESREREGETIEESERYLPENLHIIWKEMISRGERVVGNVGVGGEENEKGLISDKYDLLESNPIAKKKETSNEGEVLDSLKYSSRSNRHDGSLSSRLSLAMSSFSLFLYTLSLHGKRLLTIRFRNRSTLLVYLSINLIMAIALSSGFSIFLQSTYYGVLNPSVDEGLQAYFPSPYSRYASDNVMSMGFAQLLFFMSSALGCASCLAAVPVFVGTLSLAKREDSSGISVLSFVTGRVLADIVFVIINAFVFAGIWGLFGHAGKYYDWLAVILCTAFASSGLGYLASAMTDTASVVAIVMCFICCVFAGVEPRLAQVEIYPVISWPWYLSFATWTAEATYITWSKYLLDNGHVSVPLQDGADMYGYDVEHGFGRSVGALMTLGVVLRVLAGYIMYRRVKA